MTDFSDLPNNGRPRYIIISSLLSICRKFIQVIDAFEISQLFMRQISPNFQ